MMTHLNENLDVKSWIYADAYLRQERSRKLRKPDINFYYRGPRARIIPLSEPGLWLPLSCAIAIADGGNAHTKTISTSGTISTIGATLITIVAGWLGSATSPNDSQSNSYTGLTEQIGSFTTGTKIWYCQNPSTSASHTFTANGSQASLTIIAFSGAGVFDQENGSSLVSSPSVAGSITPSEDNSLVISGLCGLVLSITSIDGGFADPPVEFQPFESDVNISSAISYLVQTSAAAANPTWTYSAISNQSMAAASFKAAVIGSTKISMMSVLGVG